MKKIIAVIVICVISLSLFSCGEKDFVNASYIVKLKSENGFIINLDTDEIRYFGGRGDDIVYPASTTKLLTSLAALGLMPPDELITPGDEVYLPLDGSSFAYIRPNHTLTLEMLVEGMIIPSGNDAAYAAAAGCGYILLEDSSADYTDAVAAFVKYMNSYAENLGCTNTNFTSPDGFAGSEHYSTLHDMALISKAAAENEIITEYAKLLSDDVTYASGHINTWVNTNKMLDPDSKYYCKDVVGLKTGSLEDSFSLVVLYNDGELRLIIGLFGAKKDSDRYTDALNIIEAEKEVFRTNK